MAELFEVLLPLLGAALVIVVALAVSKSLRQHRGDDVFQARLAEVGRSEFEEEEKDDKTSITNWSKYWYEASIAAGRYPDSEEAPGRTVTIHALLGLGVGTLVVGEPALGVMLAFLAVGVNRVLLTAGKNRRAKKLDKQLPTLISSMRQNLQSNFTPQQALLAVVDDMPAPLGEELKILRDEINVNVPFATALRNLSERVGSREMQFLISSIEIASSSGSDLDPQLKIIQDILVKRSRIAAKLATAVASVQPTIWISGIAIPGAMIGSMFAGNILSAEGEEGGGNLDFWLSPLGIALFCVVVLLYVLGLFLSIRFAKKIENM